MPPYSEAELAIVEEWKKVAKINISTNENIRNEFFVAADCLAGSYRGDSQNMYSAADVQAGIEKLYKREWFKDTVELPFGNTTIHSSASFVSYK